MGLFDDDTPEDFDSLAAEVDAAVTSDNSGLKPPRENMLCEGHSAIENKLLKLFNADRLPHAMIFSGPKGIGKATFAYRLARFLLAQEPGDALFGQTDTPAESFDLSAGHPVSRRISSGGHADLLTIGRVYDTQKGRMSNDVPVEEVRKVTPFLRKTASEGGWRVVIVDEAEHLNRSSQNALLKILEEPPAHAVLILITDQPGRFLPTIRSRCQVYHFDVLDDEIMNRLLQISDAEMNASTHSALKLLGQGRIGYALSLVEAGGVEAYEDMIDLLSQLPDVDSAYAFQLSEKLGRDRKVYPVFMDLLLEWLSKMARLQVRGILPPPVIPREEGVTARLAEIYTPQNWLNRYEDIAVLLRDTDRINLDMKQTVLEVIWALEKEAGNKT